MQRCDARWTQSSWPTSFAAIGTDTTARASVAASEFRLAVEEQFYLVFPAMSCRSVRYDVLGSGWGVACSGLAVCMQTGVPEVFSP